LLALLVWVCISAVDPDPGLVGSASYCRVLYLFDIKVCKICCKMFTCLKSLKILKSLEAVLLYTFKIA
jgi:hypothetical protein